MTSRCYSIDDVIVGPPYSYYKNAVSNELCKQCTFTMTLYGLRKVGEKEYECESRESGDSGGNAIRPSFYTGNTAAELA